jgi:hypothetical protein
LQRLLVQIGVYGEDIDVDAYVRAATALMDQPLP